jgi:cellulose synthase/poly-beta-1,6-N-acetylglucosamine synthase-like glycosyltransferase
LNPRSFGLSTSATTVAERPKHMKQRWLICFCASGVYFTAAIHHRHSNSHTYLSEWENFGCKRLLVGFDFPFWWIFNSFGMTFEIFCFFLRNFTIFFELRI